MLVVFHLKSNDFNVQGKEQVVKQIEQILPPPLFGLIKSNKTALHQWYAFISTSFFGLFVLLEENDKQKT